HVERFAAQVKLGRITVRQRQALRTRLLFDCERRETVTRHQNVRVDLRVERPIIPDERAIIGGIDERRGHRVAGFPYSDLAVADGVAQAKYVGARIGRIDNSSALFQITARTSLDVSEDDHRGHSDTRYRTQQSVDRFPETAPIRI